MSNFLNFYTFLLPQSDCLWYTICQIRDFAEIFLTWKTFLDKDLATTFNNPVSLKYQSQQTSMLSNRSNSKPSLILLLQQMRCLIISDSGKFGHGQI